MLFNIVFSIFTPLLVTVAGLTITAFIGYLASEGLEAIMQERLPWFLRVVPAFVVGLATMFFLFTIKAPALVVVLAMIFSILGGSSRLLKK